MYVCTSAAEELFVSTPGPRTAVTSLTTPASVGACAGVFRRTATLSGRAALKKTAAHNLLALLVQKYKY